MYMKYGFLKPAERNKILFKNENSGLIVGKADLLNVITNSCFERKKQEQALTELKSH